MAIKKLKRVVIKEEFVALTNNVTEAIILNQMIYWLERAKDFDMFIEQEKKRSKANGQNISIEKSAGWVYKTAEELSEETMLRISVQNMRLHIKKLIALGYLDERNNPKYKWDKTKQYRVNLIKIQEDLNKLGYKLEGYYFEPSETNNAPEPAESSNSQIVNGVNKSEIHMNNSEVQSEQFVNAIPEITTEITTEITNSPLTPQRDDKEKEKNKREKNAPAEHIIVKRYIEEKVSDMKLRTKIFSILNNRVQARRPITMEFAKQMLSKLEEYSMGDYDKKIKILEQAIDRGYIAVYDLMPYHKGQKSYNGQTNNTTSYDINKWETDTNSDEYSNYLLGLIQDMNKSQKKI